MRRTLDQLLAAPGLTRGRFIALAVVSLVATATVVAAGQRHDRTPWELIAAVQGRDAPVVEVAARPAAAAPVADDAVAADAPADVTPVADSPTSDTPAADSQPTPTETTPAPVKPVSKVKHVFVLSVPAVEASDPNTPTYLDGTLRPQGRSLEGYKPLSEGDLATEVALVSGQKPTPGITQGCPSFGGDCLFPVETLTLSDQFVSKGMRWRGYFGAMPAACTHPDADKSEDPSADYTFTRNPFVLFRSLTELGECGANDLPLDSLTTDLATADATPNFVYVAPPRSAVPDQFLADWVPKILDSAAYKADGLLIVLVAGKPALLVSQFATPGSASSTPYDPYGLLRGIEDLFGLDYLSETGTSFAKTELAAGLP
jgi:hypothetical protein